VAEGALFAAPWVPALSWGAPFRCRCCGERFAFVRRIAGYLENGQPLDLTPKQYKKIPVDEQVEVLSSLGDVAVGD